MTDLRKRSRNEPLLCPSQLSRWARWQHRAENRSRRESCDLLPNVPRWKQRYWNPSTASKELTACQILYFSKRAPHRGIVDPKVELWWESRCGSNLACAQSTRCTQTGRCSAVTFHWPSPETWLRMRFWSWIVMVGTSRIKSTAFTV